MFRAGLTRSELRAYHTALRSHHSLRVRVYVLNMDGDVISDLTEVLDDGQVDVDLNGEVTRSASLSFTDKGRTMDFDSDSPADGALFANRQLRIEYQVKVDALNDCVSIPIFTGPVVKLDRSGDTVNVEAQGRESLSIDESTAWEPMTVKKGVTKVDAIKRIMRERGRTARFDFNDLHARLPKAVSLGRDSSPWLVCQKIADSMGKQLYFNGAGVLVLRDPGDNDVFTFSDGDGGEVKSSPQISFSVENCWNNVWVKGGKPKAKKRANETRAEFEARQEKERGVRYSCAAPRSHPLSPWRLGTDDSPRFITRVIENDHVRSEKEARKVADNSLKNGLRQAIDVTFDSLVIPHLEEGDMVRVDTDILSMAFRLRAFSIPLRHDGQMSVGYTKRVSRTHRRPNRRKHKARRHR